MRKSVWARLYTTYRSSAGSVSKKLYVVEWKLWLGSVLLAWGVLSIWSRGKLSAAQYRSVNSYHNSSLHSGLVWKISGGPWGNIRKTWAILLRLPSKPLFSFTVLYKISQCTYIHKPSPTTWRTNADGSFPSKVCSFFACSPLFGSHSPVAMYRGYCSGFTVPCVQYLYKAGLFFSA